MTHPDPIRIINVQFVQTLKKEGKNKGIKEQKNTQNEPKIQFIFSHIV